MEAESTILLYKREKFARVADLLTAYADAAGENVNQGDLANMISVANRGRYQASEQLEAIEHVMPDQGLKTPEEERVAALLDYPSSDLLPDVVADAIDYHQSALDNISDAGGSARQYRRHQKAIDSIVEEFTIL